MEVEEVFAELMRRARKLMDVFDWVRRDDKAFGKQLRMSTELNQHGAMLCMDVDRMDSPGHKEGFYWVCAIYFKYKKNEPGVQFGQVTSKNNEDIIACYEGMVAQYTNIVRSLQVVKQYDTAQQVPSEFYRKEKITRLS